ncbi:molybdate ABC transporter substrate-binding protein [Polycladomyces sp. WAk]|uniref:Molybdate ABC transporter substrate-binding protein n=1 Tax=Polycladomyces zharkentensis TaxID=2807616 RepID=A0ABS2WLV5_9BACL|nr:molybdate ABC transporter substrate-binding protein [Polycladomyces sp. WAk]MBN2910505.1 molybdate ABC transporter substrate-binding protein [Polycladomyces sp. WAk]
MKRFAHSFGWIAVVLMMIMTVACNRGENDAHPQQVEISVLAAASLTDAMKEIKSRYESTHPGVHLVTSFASSGKLKQQIEQGAPADLFLSAGAKEMDALVRAGIVDPRDRSDLLSNELVLIVPKNSRLKVSGFSDLPSPHVKTIAIGQPETVPAGQYAKQALENMNLWKKVQSKLVFAGDVRQVLAYVKTGNVDAGIVYRSDIRSAHDVETVAVADPKTHQPIVYPVGVIKATPHAKQTRDFYKWLRGPEAMKIFQKYGFEKAHHPA